MTLLSILKQIPEEEKNLGPHDRLIHVYHFMKDPNQNQQIQNFGDPFLMVIREVETAAEVLERIQRKLRVPDEDFSKVIYSYMITISYGMDLPRASPSLPSSFFYPFSVFFFSYPCFLWASSLVCPNLSGTKGHVFVVIVGCHG
jgi:hypothetical protein